MSALRTKQGQFYTNDIASIGDAATHTTDSDVIDVGDWPFMGVSLFGTGAQATCASDIIATFVCSPDNSSWDTLAAFQLRTTMNGTTLAQASCLADMRGYRFIKCTSIENEDDTSDDDALNVNIKYLLKG